MNKTYPHITVCICTLKRPLMLQNLLNALTKQITNDLFSFSVVVVDNDVGLSARSTVDQFKSQLNICYDAEIEQNISLARNRTIANAKGDFIAFIDDDEFPNESWLLLMYKTLIKHNVHGVLGPVRPVFVKKPKKWIIRGKYFEKGFITTGTIINWMQTRTSNVLMKNLTLESEFHFKEEYGRGGEDMDLFKRLMAKGYSFIWCNEAPVFEKIPPERCHRAFFLKRAMLRGQVAGTTLKKKSVFNKSFIAVLCNSLLLPVTILFGQHIFMKHLEKIAWHGGFLLAILKKPIIKDYYVMCTDIK